MKRFILYGVILFQIGLIISLVRGMQLSLRSKERIAALQTTKQRLEGEQAQLQQNAAYVQSSYYVERVAREELHLAKPGEKVVIIPEGRIVENKELADAKAMAGEARKSNWVQWWEILSGKIE